MFKIFNVFFLFWFSLAVSASEHDFARFIKLEQTEDGGKLLQAYREYESPQGGPIISFFSMCHMGSPSYFKRLIAEMNAADIVMYEFVGNLPQIISALNTHEECLETLKLQEPEYLSEGLQKQILAYKDIDFDSEKYIHADMSGGLPGHFAPELSKELCAEQAKILLTRAQTNLFHLWMSNRLNREDKGLPVESFFSWKEPKNADEVIKLYKKYPARLRKLTTEEASEFLEDRATCLDFEKYNPQREEVLYSKLQSILEIKTPSPKNILITYGAAHGPDIEKNLRERFGYHPKSEKWILVHRY